MTSTPKQRAYRFGLWAEMLCVLRLTCSGYRILAHRHRTPMGEIDLIARRGNRIAFIEVKARQLLEDGLYALQPKQQQRIIRAAKSYLSSHPKYATLSPQFDLMVVAKRGWPAHVPHAFDAS